MNLHELGAKLSDMYENAKEGEKVTMIHLFGIKYAEQIKNLDEPLRKVISAANIHASYNSELSKGVKLSSYVKEK